MLSELSNISRFVNGPMLFITVVSVVFLIGITVTMVYFAFRYSRKRNPKAEEIHGHEMLEIVWTVIPTVLAFGMFWYGWVGYEFMKTPPDDAMAVEVTGRMWSWSHKYENGIETPELYIPVDKPVRLNLHSSDVIHSYYIPAFKVKQDVVPGLNDFFLWFSANQVGVYDVLCAEFCGTNHSAMLTKIHVLEQNEYDAWYESEGAKVVQVADALDSGGGNMVAAGQHLSTTKGCIACHSSDGSALIGPSFKGLFGKTEIVITAGVEREITVDEEYLRTSILKPADDLVKGFQPLMPSQEGLVTDDEINAIIDYIKSLE